MQNCGVSDESSDSENSDSDEEESKLYTYILFLIQYLL